MTRASGLAVLAARAFMSPPFVEGLRECCIDVLIVWGSEAEQVACAGHRVSDHSTTAATSHQSQGQIRKPLPL
eukprot:2434887-Prymnesium_polylepis.2